MRIWRPYTQEKTAAPPIKVEGGSGAYLRLASGREVFDGISSWWLITHGHGHPAIRDAVAAQAKKLQQVVFAQFTHEPAEQLAEALGEVLPAELNRVFFSDNGSTAVEVAMKMALQFQQQSGRSKRKRFLAFARSYHGDTCGAMSVSQEGVFTQNYRRLLFDVVRCEQGRWSSDPYEAWVSDFRAQLEQHGEEICALLIEPLVQGAGGMIVWPREAVLEICREARRRGILVIFDEVMTGFGRTGSLFAFEQLGFVPDFLCLSKGLTGGFLPMGLTLTSAAVEEAFLDESPARMFFHGHSFTGNALSCAAAVANLEIWKQEKVRERLEEIRGAHARALASFSGPVREARVCGTIGVLELDLPLEYGSAFGRGFSAACLREGIYLRPMGKIIYLMPPYCSAADEVGRAWDIIAEALRFAFQEAGI